MGLEVFCAGMFWAGFEFVFGATFALLSMWLLYVGVTIGAKLVYVFCRLLLEKCRLLVRSVALS